MLNIWFGARNIYPGQEEAPPPNNERGKFDNNNLASQ